MAFQAPNSGQGRPTVGQQANIDIENANRKILQQLEEEKKRLRLQAITPNIPNVKPINSGSIISTPVSGGPPIAVQQQATVPVPQMMTGLENQQMTPAQRTALQHAHANSVGYFITQDSSFGNLILPVLPRFDR